MNLVLDKERNGIENADYHEAMRMETPKEVSGIIL
jgi:hypothetical protein